MNERLYKQIVNTGIWNLVGGIILLIGGITMGVLMVVSGAKLLRSKNNLVF